MIDIVEELILLEDKYKAPILIVLGNLFSVLGKFEDAEKIYLDTLDVYKKLTKPYYRIYWKSKKCRLITAIWRALSKS